MADTPPQYKMSGLNVFFPQAAEVYSRIAREMRGCWVGPFPILEFLGSLPGRDPFPNPPSDIFNKISAGEIKKEKEMYSHLITALDSLQLKNLQFKNTSDHPDPGSPSYKKWRPDISVYCSDIKFEAPDAKDPTYASKAKAKVSPTRFSELVLSFELKQGKHDPFSDKPDGPDSRFESAFPQIQGQIAAILNEMLSFTWRTHAFSVFMDGHIARLFRADRAGVLVSEAFDYRENPEHLTNFLHCLNNMTPSQRGFDITFDRRYKIIWIPSFNIAVSKYNAVDLEGKEELPPTESLVGRGHRVVRVRDRKSKQPLIMKDGWRPAIPGATPEWTIVSELNRDGVLHIPTISFGGDIAGYLYHRTGADTFANYHWRIGPKTKLTPRVHYRFTENDAGRPLDEVSTAKELASALRDVIITLRDAWVKCRYLHRDVNSKNILISPSGEGVLIDWELAKKYPEGEESHGRVSGRTGTWAYMSTALLMNKNKPHSPLDDLQSVYWVGLENSLNNLEHNYTADQLLKVARCLVEYSPDTDDGGYRKAFFLRKADSIEYVGNPAFSNLMQDFREVMNHAADWQFDHIGSSTLETQTSPDALGYDRVLQIFKEALERPDHEWSSNPYENRNQLQPFMEEAVRVGLSGTRSQQSGSQRTSQPSVLQRTSQRSGSRRHSQRSGSKGSSQPSELEPPPPSELDLPQPFGSEPSEWEPELQTSSQSSGMQESSRPQKTQMMMKRQRDPAEVSSTQPSKWAKTGTSSTT